MRSKFYKPNEWLCSLFYEKGYAGEVFHAVAYYDQICS